MKRRVILADFATDPPRRCGCAAAALIGLLVLLIASPSPASSRAVIDVALQPSPAQSLYVRCRGVPSALPTVVLEAGAFGTSADWARVQAILARTGRVCAYDRAGLGDSPRGDGAADALAIARRLAGLLDDLGETRPVVLVGHSNGALYVETFAILFPQRTAGLAYVDGVGSDDLDSPEVTSNLESEAQLAQLAVGAGHLGLMRLFVGQFVDEIGLRGRAARRKVRALTSLRHLRASRDEVEQILPSLAEVRALGRVDPAIPTVAIVAALWPQDEDAKAWRSVQVAPAQRACRGWVLDAAGASHASTLGRDRAYVIAAVQWLQSEAMAAPATSCTAASFKS